MSDSNDGSNRCFVQNFYLKIDSIYHKNLKEKVIESLAYFTSFSLLKKHKLVQADLLRKGTLLL